MSHWATIQTEIRDIPALREACRELGLTLETAGQARGYSASIPGEYVIKCRGRYDIAVNRTSTGAYGLTTDWWGGDVAQNVGHKFGRLIQLYGVHKATAAARARGLTVARVQGSNGSICLTIGGAI